MEKNKKNLEVIKKIPNVGKYENTRVAKKQNWFNRNLAFLILVLFILLGVIITLIIAI